MASDGNIHFPPGQRRDKPSFEPPPWERDQFDELAKRKQDSTPTTPSEEEVVHAGQGVGVTGAPVEVQLVPKPSEPEQDGGVGEDGEAALAKPELDPKQVEMLLMGLRSEEPRPEEAYWKITTGAGVLSALIGLAMATWGLVAMAMPKRPGAGPLLLVAVLLVFGIGFVVVGFWVVFRSLRQQGVL